MLKYVISLIVTARTWLACERCPPSLPCYYHSTLPSIDRSYILSFLPSLPYAPVTGLNILQNRPSYSISLVNNNRITIYIYIPVPVSFFLSLSLTLWNLHLRYRYVCVPRTQGFQGVQHIQCTKVPRKRKCLVGTL